MSEKIIDIIKVGIERFPQGEVFTLANFSDYTFNPKVVSNTLNRLVEQGILRRLSKGRFYRPEMSKFGELPPDTYQVVKDLIEQNGKTIGYITGYTDFNDLGLTTQVPAVLQIGVKKEKKAVVRGAYKIRFIKQENAITKENIPLLRLLDCLRLFKDIPDTLPDAACYRLIVLFERLSSEELTKVKRLALKYNPATIALLGAILETINPEESTEELYKKLNPITIYKLNISENTLPAQNKWNIR